MNKGSLQDEDGQAGLQVEQQAGLKEEDQIGLQEAEPSGLQESEQEQLQEEEQAGLQDEERAGLQDKKQAGLQDKKQAGLQDEEQAGLQDKKQGGLQDKKQAGLQDEEQAGLQDEEHAGLQGEEPEEFSWRPSYDIMPTDFTLIVESVTESWKFFVHKDVLIKSSDYFSAMLSSEMIESKEGVANLQLVTADVLKVLVEAMYTGDLELTQENVFEMVKAAEMLQIQDPLKSVYLAFLKNAFINLRNCFQLMDFCLSLNLQDLYCDVRKFCLAHFSEFKSSNTLTNLSLAQLSDYLSDKYLLAETELHVVEVIYAWVCANKNTDPYNLQHYNLRDKVKKMITDCVSLKDDEDEVYKIIMDEVFNDKWDPVEYFEWALSERSRREEVFMFGARLTSSKVFEGHGLTDILKLDLDTGNVVKVGTMPDIVTSGCLGSAVCRLGPCVYISAGDYDLGLQIWRFDVSKPYSPWETVGHHVEFHCDHAMVILEHKLYIFGGFVNHGNKSTQMHSLDLATGDWEKLPPMPVHKCKPPTATTDNCIYYVDSGWNLCYYSVEVKNWTRLFTFKQFPIELDKFRPLTLLPVVSVETKCFAVATLIQCSLKIKLLRKFEHICTVTDVADMDIHFTFAKSVAVNGKLVFFFTSNTRDDPCSVLVQNEGGKTLQTAYSFDPKTNEFHHCPNIQNVKQTLAVVALPYFPGEFCMKTTNSTQH